MNNLKKQAAQGPDALVARRARRVCGHVCRLFFGTLDMKLTSVMEGIMLKHYDKIDRDQHL